MPKAEKKAREKATRVRFVGAGGAKLVVWLRPRSDGFLTFLEHLASKGAKATHGLYALHATREEATKAYDAHVKGAKDGGWTESAATGGRKVPTSDFTTIPPAAPAKPEEKPGPKAVPKAASK